MTIYYLYIKTHNKTGLKYLGQTSKDPFIYKGSGTIWLKHLKKHGYDVSTQIVGTFNNKEDLKKIALEISENENIVVSTKWANLQPEAGVGVAPGWVTIKDSDDSIKRIHKSEYNRNIHTHINKNRKYSDEVNKKKGRSDKKPDKTKENIRKGLNGYYAKGNKGAAHKKYWFHDPVLLIESFRYSCPEGWLPGRLKEKEETKHKKSLAHTGTKWYHNFENTMEKCLKSCPEGWLPGRLKR